MKAIVENSVIYTQDDSKDMNMLCEFNEIIQCITLSESKQSCIDRLNNSFKRDSRYFAFGFCSNHLWVHQKIKGEVQDERIIFTPFE